MEGWITFEDSTTTSRSALAHVKQGNVVLPMYDKLSFGRSVSQPPRCVGSGTCGSSNRLTALCRSEWVSFDGPLSTAGGEAAHPFFVPQKCPPVRCNRTSGASREPVVDALSSPLVSAPGLSDGISNGLNTASEHNTPAMAERLLSTTSTDGNDGKDDSNSLLGHSIKDDDSAFMDYSDQDTTNASSPDMNDPLPAKYRVHSQASSFSGDGRSALGWDDDDDSSSSQHEKSKPTEHDDNDSYRRLVASDHIEDVTGSIERLHISSRSLSDSYSDNLKSCADDQLGSARSLDAPIIESTLDNYPTEGIREDWAMLYRYPHRKRRLGSRDWLPVSITIRGETLRLFGLMNNAEVVKEIQLHPFVVFSVPRLHKNDHVSKVHCVTLQYVKYKETRKVQLKAQVDHTPVYTPVLKIANSNYKILLEFTEAVENVIRKIPTYRHKDITYRYQEVFIDCDDVCQFLLSGGGSIVKYNITTQMRLRTFLTGTPDVTVYLNDLSKRGVQDMTLADNPARRTSKPLKWITPLRVEQHPCVNSQASRSNGGVVFHPPDGCSFELMRFRVRNTKQLPLLATSCLEIISSHLVELHAEVQMCPDATMRKLRRNNITLRFPIPNSWTPMFVRSRRLDGRVKYVKAAADPRSMVTQIGRNSRFNIEVTIGSAKYEPAFSALVWRIGSLPCVGSGQPFDFVQRFKCRLEVPFEIHAPDGFRPFSELEFEVPQALGSDVTVREVLLSDGKTPDKWVCYRSHFSYKILMRLIDHGREIPRCDEM